MGARQVALVTGAGRGIGRAIALGLAEDGLRIAIFDINLPAAEETVAAIRSRGGEALAFEGDVSRKPDVEQAVAKVLAAFGSVDVLVNNAGIVGRAIPVADMTDEDWSSVLAVDLNGVFFFTRAVLPHMLRQNSGRIINIASIAGKEGNPNMAAYSAAKGAVIAFTKSVAKEVAAKGIRAHSIAPGVIKTELLNQLTSAQVQYLLDRIPMGRFGHVEEVANLVRFLASERMTFSTGACFDVSGGRAVY